MKKLTFILINSNRDEVEELRKYINNLFPGRFTIIECSSTQDAVIRMRLQIPDFVFIALDNDETHDCTLATMRDIAAVPTIHLTYKEQFMELNALHGNGIIIERPVTPESVILTIERILLEIESNISKKTGLVVAPLANTTQKQAIQTVFDISNGIKGMINGSYQFNNPRVLESAINVKMGKGSEVTNIDGFTYHSPWDVYELKERFPGKGYLATNRSELINTNHVDENHVFSLLLILLKSGSIFYPSKGYIVDYRKSKCLSYTELSRINFNRKKMVVGSQFVLLLDSE